ncbi:hypothetical protein F7725_009273 [Dissostichus mawsoni]|uniref:Uncharacterized protein n=1 Tax=Dissostichus mawsoni TaxID=36200 RepID=A0A7J5Z6J3_DISMA|nr:hypothetical protein F7725_009273 [Dissostichus mawsoni]
MNASGADCQHRFTRAESRLITPLTEVQEVWLCPHVTASAGSRRGGCRWPAHPGPVPANQELTRRAGPDCNPYFCLQKPALEEQYQAKEGKDEEGEILAVLLSPSPSLPCSLLPGSAGRQMTRVCGRLITPGWVFSNLFNGSLLKKKQDEEEEEEEWRTQAEGRSLAPVARGGNLAKEQTNEEEEDAPSPLVRGQEHHFSQMSSLPDGEAPRSFLRCCLVSIWAQRSFIFTNGGTKEISELQLPEAGDSGGSNVQPNDGMSSVRVQGTLKRTIKPDTMASSSRLPSLLPLPPALRSSDFQSLIGHYSVIKVQHRQYGAPSRQLRDMEATSGRSAGPADDCNRSDRTHNEVRRSLGSRPAGGFDGDRVFLRGSLPDTSGETIDAGLEDVRKQIKPESSGFL